MNAADKAKIVAAFREEANERLLRLTQAFLSLESSGEPHSATVETIQRELHSLKGSAAMVGFGEISTVVHDIESAMNALSGDNPPARAPLVTTALSAFDSVQRWIEASARDLAIPPDELERTRTQVAALQNERPSLVERPATATPPEETPPLAGSPTPERIPATTERAALPPAKAPSPMSAAAASEPEPAPQTNARENAAPAGDAAGNKAAEAMPGPTALAADTALEPRFLRVSVEQLDGLLGQAEELVVTGTRVRPRIEAIQTTVDTLDALVRELEREKRVRQRTGRGRRSSEDPLDGAVVQLRRMRQRLAATAWELTVDLERAGTLSGALLADLRVARMLPASNLFETFRRPVRDMAAEQGKNIRFEVAGGEVRLDKTVLDLIKDPLVHLLRNAVVHGLETATERFATGKPPFGKLSVAAEQRGNRVVITVHDDGRGIDQAAVKATAVRHRLVDEKTAASLSEAEVHALIFRDGFSTRERASSDAGRGMGLAVVRERCLRVRGEVSVSTEAGKGTTFSLLVPLTVASTRGLLVASGRELFAIPVTMVERVMRVPGGEVKPVQGIPKIDVSGQPVRLVPLGELVNGLASRAMTPREGAVSCVVVASGRRRLALEVDTIVGELEVITRDLPGALSAVPLLAGATILDDGRVVPVLDPAALIAEARGQAASVAQSLKPRRVPKIIVADDSATTRMVLGSELEAAGYQVVTATDGAHALDLLKAEGADGVVSDVNMPNLDGFELTRSIRASEAFADVPVVLVTSQESPEDRARGAEVGADAYMIKKDFGREALLQTLDGLMRRQGFKEKGVPA